jgi:hypothetical protein
MSDCAKDGRIMSTNESASGLLLTSIKLITFFVVIGSLFNLIGIVLSITGTPGDTMMIGNEKYQSLKSQLFFFDLISFLNGCLMFVNCLGLRRKAAICRYFTVVWVFIIIIVDILLLPVAQELNNLFLDKEVMPMEIQFFNFIGQFITVTFMAIKYLYLFLCLLLLYLPNSTRQFKKAA